jgi:hypothetical protein
MCAFGRSDLVLMFRRSLSMLSSLVSEQPLDNLS